MATGSLGMRTATVSSPPVVPYGTASLLGNIMVSGPGQNASISFPAASGISATRGFKSEKSAICAISGLSEGLPFAAYIFFAASSSRALAPSPYTVSVGNATRPPSRKISAALSSFPASILCVSSIIIRSVTIFLRSLFSSTALRNAVLASLRQGLSPCILTAYHSTTLSRMQLFT